MFWTILTWLAWLELLGLIALPFAFYLFRNLPDRGYPLSKALGILLLSYLVWLGASLHVIANRRWSIILVLLVLLIGAVFLARRQWGPLKAFFFSNLWLIVTTEVIFLAGIVAWSIYRSYDPFIQIPEAPYNFAFINSIMRSNYMPPPDPWLSGFPLNTYYFGHFIMATITKLMGMPSYMTWNLASGLIFALSALGVFSLTFNLIRINQDRAATFKKATLVGLCSVFFLLLIGNLEGILEFLYAHNIGSTEFWKWISIKGLTQPYSSEHWYPTEVGWWSRAARVMDTLTPEGGSLDITLNDFIFFNLLVGYPHAHIVALPFSLLALGFGLNLFMNKEFLGWDWFRRNWFLMVPVMISFGALGVTNSWDLATYGSLLIVLVFIHGYVHRQGRTGPWWLDTLIMAALTGIGIFLSFLPYYNSYQPYSGFKPWLGPGARSLHLFLLFGLLFIAVMAFLVVYPASSWKRVPWKVVLVSPLPLVIPIVIWILTSTKEGITAITPSLGTKLFNMWPLLALILFTLVVGLTRILSRDAMLPANKTATFVLLCVFVAFYAIFGLEYFYFKDATPHGRGNTIFKFYYHVWVLMTIGGSYGLYHLFFRWKPAAVWLKVGRAGWCALIGVLLAGSLLYSTGAVLARTNFFKGQPTLNGLAFLPPAEREVVDWLNNNVQGSPVIAEATNIWSLEENRISVRTGLPAILGWIPHEMNMRGSDTREFMARVKDLETIYQDEDLFKVQSLLTKYETQYIVVGWLERERFGAGIKERFDGWFEKAFSNGAATIYKASPTLWRPAKSPKAEIGQVFYREPATGAFYPLSDNGELPQDTYHFNAHARNVGPETVTVYLEVIQSDGARMTAWGAPEWELPPNQGVALFMQGGNLRPAGKTVRITFALKEKGSNRVLDTKTLTVKSK